MGIAGAAVNSTKFLCDTLPHMSISTGIVVTVTFQQVNIALYAEASAQHDNQDLQNVNRRRKNAISGKYIKEKLA